MVSTERNVSIQQVLLSPWREGFRVSDLESRLSAIESKLDGLIKAYGIEHDDLPDTYFKPQPKAKWKGAK